MGSFRHRLPRPRVGPGLRRRGVLAAGAGPVVEPTSKLDAIRVLDEIGIAAPSYPTIKMLMQAIATVWCWPGRM